MLLKQYPVVLGQPVCFTQGFVYFVDNFQVLVAFEVSKGGVTVDPCSTIQ